jgi:NADH-quinone oxidoreductase subunit K
MFDMNYFDFAFASVFIVNFLIFFTSLGGLFGTRRNLIIVFICIELILLASFLNFIYIAIYIDDLQGHVFSLVILGLAAAESATGLALLVASYRHKAIVSIDLFSILKS